MLKSRVSGEEIWKSKMEKVDLELFAMTYGSLVSQLCKDLQDAAQINKQLDKMYESSKKLIV